MRYQGRIHTPETFQVTLNECLFGDYRQKVLRRRQLQHLLIDIGACRVRCKFRNMTLREAWDTTTGERLLWWLRRVMKTQGESALGRITILNNIENVVNSTFTMNTPAAARDARLARVLRAWFRPDGSLRKTWIS